MADKKIYDVASKWKTFIAIPVCICIAAIIVMIFAGMEVAIEFRGGTMLKYSFEGALDTNAVTSAVEDMGYGAVRVTAGSTFGSELETVTISFASNEGLTSEVQKELSDSLFATFSENKLALINSQDVNPTIGSQFFLKCLIAVLFSFILLVIYIAFRFRKIGGWSAGIFALVALMTDVFMVVCTFAFFRLQIDANFMAVVLTVLGYSINNTIVVYDRIRENRALYGKKLTHRELVNKSIKQSLTRSVNTSVTTGLAVLVICIVSMVYGVTSIFSFAFPMIIGIISGTFTSLCLSGPLWVAWQEHKIGTVKPKKA